MRATVQFSLAHKYGLIPDPGNAAFAQVKGEVTEDYETSSYNALITRLAGSASVRVDAGVLAGIQIS